MNKIEYPFEFVIDLKKSGTGNWYSFTEYLSKLGFKRGYNKYPNLEDRYIWVNIRTKYEYHDQKSCFWSFADNIPDDEYLVLDLSKMEDKVTAEAASAIIADKYKKGEVLFAYSL